MWIRADLWRAAPWRRRVVVSSDRLNSEPLWMRQASCRTPMPSLRAQQRTPPLTPTASTCEHFTIFTTCGEHFGVLAIGILDAVEYFIDISYIYLLTPGVLCIRVPLLN